MNVQAIICSFILSVGVILIVVGSGGMAMTKNEGTDQSVHTILKYVGIAVVVVGACGYLFTLGEIIYRGHQKYKTGEEKARATSCRLASNRAEETGSGLNCSSESNC
ncbi:hypothetical protein L596_005639 [Steinernema carpocapsae]|uniref:Uncharacterized protein n=1 Tax=Steinernema carpocapsae TaxID=34508 RepID=A0A4U8V192_STECR|nr:hypothetical protein L596_005639 [Steinernema carpocapsae]